MDYIRTSVSGWIPAIVKLYLPSFLFHRMPSSNWEEDFSRLEIEQTSSAPPFREFKTWISHSSHPTSTTRQGTIKTRFLCISDTHSVPLFPAEDKIHCFRTPLPHSDVLLHAGDLSKRGILNEYKITYEVIKSSTAELKLVIAGNHDVSLDEKYCRSWGFGDVENKIKEARELWTSEDAKENGIVYLEEGVRTFELSNGAKFTIFASPYSPEFCNWAFASGHKEDRYNANSLFGSKPHPIPSWPKVDIMMTHGPPWGFLDQTQRGQPMSVGCRALRKAVERVRPRLHVFGHIHEGWGAERVQWLDGKAWPVQTHGSADPDVREKGAVEVDLTGPEGESKEPLKWGEETLMVNAAILTIRYRPTNPAWIVDLDLPAKEASSSEDMEVREVVKEDTEVLEGVQELLGTA